MLSDVWQSILSNNGRNRIEINVQQVIWQCIPTVTVYDVLDQNNTSVTLPDNSTTTTAYTVDNGSHALVTTVTDALHNVQATHTNGSGKTEDHPEERSWRWDYHLVWVWRHTAPCSCHRHGRANVTTPTYDMGDRRMRWTILQTASPVSHTMRSAMCWPKQTANLAKEGKFITYDYDYQRLTGINYPDHPENNVKYYYGGRNASQNRIGKDWCSVRTEQVPLNTSMARWVKSTKTRRTMIIA